MQDIISLILQRVAETTQKEEKDRLFALIEDSIKANKELELAKQENQILEKISARSSVYVIKNGASLNLDSGKGVFISASGSGTKITVGKTTMTTVSAGTDTEKPVTIPKPQASSRSSSLTSLLKSNDDD